MDDYLNELIKIRNDYEIAGAKLRKLLNSRENRDKILLLICNIFALVVNQLTEYMLNYQKELLENEKSEKTSKMVSKRASSNQKQT